MDTKLKLLQCVGTFLFQLPLSHYRHFQTCEPRDIYSILIKTQRWRHVHSAQLSATFVFILHAVSIMTQIQASLACWVSSTILETGEHHTKFRIDFTLFLWLVKCRKPVRLNKLCTRTVCLCLYSWLGWGSQFEDVCTTYIETHTDVHLALNKTVLDVNTGFFSNSLPRYKFNQQL